jgi:hypothetical protein
MEINAVTLSKLFYCTLHVLEDVRLDYWLVRQIGERDAISKSLCLYAALALHIAMFYLVICLPVHMIFSHSHKLPYGERYLVIID